MLVNVPFEFDERAIEEKLRVEGDRIVDHTIRDMVRDDVIAQLPKRHTYYGYGSGEGEVDWGEAMRQMFSEYLSEHVSEIVDEAAVLLAMRAEKRKGWKAAVAEYRASLEGGAE
jgi:hypothetical protein